MSGYHGENPVEALAEAIKQRDAIRVARDKLQIVCDELKADRDACSRVGEANAEMATRMSNERDDARNALRLANERMTKIASESEGLLIRNKELSTKLLFYVEVARRICTLG